MTTALPSIEIIFALFICICIIKLKFFWGLFRDKRKGEWHTAKGPGPGVEPRSAARSLGTWDTCSTNWAKQCPRNYFCFNVSPWLQSLWCLYIPENQRCPSLHTEHMLCVGPHDPWGDSILRKRTHSLQISQECTSLQWDACRTPSQSEAGEKKKRKKETSNLTPHMLPQWLTACSIRPIDIRCPDRQLDAGGEMSSRDNMKHWSKQKKEKVKTRGSWFTWRWVCCWNKKR